MKLPAIFQKKADPVVPQGEVGWESSQIYGAGTFTKYDPDDLKGSKGHSVYANMMVDDQVKGVMQFKIHAVLSRSWYFEKETDENGNEKEGHSEMAEYFGHMIKSIDGAFNDKLVGVLSAMPHGFSISEKVYKPLMWNGKTMWGIKDIKLRPQDSFNGGFETDEHGNIEELNQSVAGQRIKIPISKVIHFVHQPDVDVHYGDSDLRACYRNYWSKEQIIKFMNLHLERHAGGFIWAKREGTLADDQETNLRNLIKNISARMGAILPKNVSLEVINPMNTDAFEKAVALHDKAIAKSVLVPNLLGITEQGNTGSYAQSQTQIGAFFWVLDQIASRLEETLNEQLFRELALWNFGTEEYPLFKFQPISDEMAREIAKAWAEILSKGAVTKSESDESYIRNLIGFPEKQDEEELPELPPEIPEELPEEGLPEFMKQMAEKPWLKRPRYAQIKSLLDEADDNFSQELADVMGQIRASLETQIARVVGNRSMLNVKMQEFDGLAIPKKFERDLKRVSRGNLTDLLHRGFGIAKMELPAKRLAQVIRPGMDLYSAEKYLADKSLRIAGVLTQGVLDDVKNVLASGIKYDKSLAQTISSINDNTRLLEVLPEVDSAGRAINIPARLANIARTNTSEAINTGRMAFFQDPANKGFIQAYEYSAILDDVTTEICRSLHGKIRKDWANYVPPNHYQCRSLLIPITVVDDWDGSESKKPTIEPQKGFG